MKMTTKSMTRWMKDRECKLIFKSCLQDYIYPIFVSLGFGRFWWKCRLRHKELSSLTPKLWDFKSLLNAAHETTLSWWPMLLTLQRVWSTPNTELIVHNVHTFTSWSTSHMLYDSLEWRCPSYLTMCALVNSTLTQLLIADRPEHLLLIIILTQLFWNFFF